MRTVLVLSAAALLTACTSAATTPPSPSASVSVPITTAKDLATELTKAVRAQVGYRFQIEPQDSSGVIAPATGLVRLTGERTASVDTTVTRVVQDGQPAQPLRYVSTNAEHTYVQLPEVFGLPKDKPWVQLKRADTDEFTDRMLAFYDIVAQQSVFTNYDLPFIAAAGVLQSSVQRDGKTTYTVEVDMRKASSALTDADLKAEADIALEAGVTSYTAVIEVDSRGLPSSIEATSTKGIRYVTFTDWGTLAAVTGPKPSELSQRG